MHLIGIREYISKLSGEGDFVGLGECDSNAHAQWTEEMPFRPTLTACDLIRSANPGMEKMILGASDMPDGITDPVLIRTGAREPFFFCQIIRIVMNDAVQISGLLFEISINVHKFLHLWTLINKSNRSSNEEERQPCYFLNNRGRNIGVRLRYSL